MPKSCTVVPVRRVPVRSMLLAASIGLAVLAATLATAGPVAGAPMSPSPFTGRVLFVDPDSNAARDRRTLALTDPAGAALLGRIADRSQADWFGDWNPPEQVASDVGTRVSTIIAAGAYPVLVVYAIPQRDCGSYSAGGVHSADDYRAWVRAFRTGIGNRRAAVVLEPDALAQLDCLSSADRTLRLALLKDAVNTLSAGGNIAVYLDAGHGSWIPPAVMASRLSQAGIANARGFSLNVSGFGWTADQVAYGRQISPAVGWKRFVVDTSRNGAGPAIGVEEAWCNPPGRALGATPTAATGDALVDAYLWLKRPGESDGTCRGGPPAGSWWRGYALGLAGAAAP
ncbi:MAG: glycoside hydrolase family 6 protein [Acidimicrobiia bacterium]